MAEYPVRQACIVGRRLRCTAVVLLLACSIHPVQASPGAAGKPGSEEGLPVPGGTAALLQAAGLPGLAEPERAFLVLIRSLYGPFAAGKGRIDPARLAASHSPSPVGTAGNGSSPGDRIPALLPISVWQDVLGQEVPDEQLATTILSDRAASFLYYGLFALDDETLGFFAARPALVGAIRERSATVFAAYSDGIRIREGRVHAPGGAAAARVWEEWLGAPASDAPRFVTALLERNEGRVAQLFAALGRLDPPRLAFALGPAARDLPALIEAAAAFEAPVQLPFASWSPIDVPFLLEQVDVTPEGSMAPPRRQAFWEAAFSGRAESAPTPDGEDVTAAWLVNRFREMPVSQRRVGLDALLFAQRRAAHRAAGTGWEWLAPAASFPASQTLFLTLEQLQATDPADYRAAATAASSVVSGYDPPQASRRLALFQGALVLVARLARVGTLAPPAALALVRELFGLAPADRPDYAAGFARWFEASLPVHLPAAGAADLEGRLLDALAGAAARAQEKPTVEWEGTTYTVDLARAERRRLDLVREKQGGISLDDAIALHQAVSRLCDAASPPARVAEAAAHVRASARFASSANDDLLFGSAVTSLRKRMIAAAKEAHDQPSARRSDSVRRRMAEGVEVVLAEVLVGLVYALHADPDAPLVAGDGPERRHDFGVGRQAGPGPWNLADTKSRNGARGSLLGLERCLAKQALRPTMLGLPPRPPTLDQEEATGLAESVVALNAFQLTDESRDAVMDAMRRGRARVSQAAIQPGALHALLTGAGVDGVRRRLALLAASATPSRVFDYLSLAEVLAIGQAEGAPIASDVLDRWGTPSRLRDGSFGQRMPARLAWRERAGRPGSALLAAQAPDLQLRVAEWLAEKRLPAMLAPGILSFAMWDLTMTAQVAGQDDWLPVLRAAQAVSADRLEDYLSALAAGGPLVRARAPGKQE